MSQSVTGHTGKTLIERSREVRNTLAEELSESAKALRETPMESVLRHIAEGAEVSQELASSAGKVFAWDSENKPGALIVVGEMRGTSPAELAERAHQARPAIDVQASEAKHD